MKKLFIIIAMLVTASASLCLAQIVQSKKSSSDTVVQDSTLSSTSNSGELEAFKAAEELNMHFAYNNFKKSYPNSALISKARNKLAKFKTFTVQTNTLIPVKDLIDIYHWNGLKKAWCWGKLLYTINQNKYYFIDTTYTPEHGLDFEFIDAYQWAGKLCVGNIQIEGKVLRKANGLLLLKGTKLIYPVKAGN